jgi:hypothetical protein
MDMNASSFCENFDEVEIGGADPQREVDDKVVCRGTVIWTAPIAMPVSRGAEKRPNRTGRAR